MGWFDYMVIHRDDIGPIGHHDILTHLEHEIGGVEGEPANDLDHPQA
jgi:hypothetical protein